MNHFTWLAMIMWGLLMFGIGLINVPQAEVPGGTLPAHDALFLVTGGLLSCMLGMLGLAGLLGWVPGFRKEKQSGA